MKTRGGVPNLTYLSSVEQPVTSNNEPRDADETEMDYISTQSGLNDVNKVAQQRTGKLYNDVRKRNEAEKAVRNENSD